MVWMATASHGFAALSVLYEQAHAHSLSIGLKNDLSHLEDLEPYYDWALNECEFYIVVICFFNLFDVRFYVCTSSVP